MPQLLQSLAVGEELGQRSLVVLAHQAAIIGNIGGNKRNKTPLELTTVLPCRMH